MRSNSKDRGWVSRYRWAAISAALLSALGLLGAQSVLAPAVPQDQTQSQTSTAPTKAGQPPPNQVSPAETQAPVQSVATPPKPLIMIDAAHGGSESGAVLNPTILEKDVTRLEHSAIFVFAGEPLGATRDCGSNSEERNDGAFTHRSVAASG